MAKLDRAQRDKARARAAGAALLAYRKRSLVHYSQGSRRWSGITSHRNAARGEVPPFADCSAFATWCLWNGLYLTFREPDHVNGAGWRYGFTGSQIEHGRRVKAPDLWRGDLVFYAKSGSTPSHVAIVVGRREGRPMVVSHGSESGPLYLPWDYRRVVQARRYITTAI
jgi:hypothetical protein